MRKTVKFNDQLYTVEFGVYPNGSTAIKLTDTDGLYAFTATTTIKGQKLEKDEVIIKNYNENAGILEALISAEVISEPIKDIQLTFTTAQVCRLLYKDNE